MDILVENGNLLAVGDELAMVESESGGSGGGGIQSAQIDEIRVLTKSAYDALAEKDARILYLVEG